MNRPPAKSGSTGQMIESAIEKALDPLASALKRATQPTAAKTPASPGKPGLMISPLAVPFPTIPPIGGVEIATARAGFYKHERDDLVVFHFPEGASCAGVFTRHKVGSAPVDWCKRHLDSDKGGEGVKALVVNAGCANAFTGKAGADAARRTASEVAKRFDCRQRDVMLASTGVIGVVLDETKITARLPDIKAGLKADAWAQAGLGIMTTDTFPKGSYAECEIEGVKVKIAGIAKGSGMIAPDMATMLAFIVTDANIAPPVLKALLNLHVRTTFNSVTVDGDTSTNDTALLFATGASGAPRIGRVGDRRLKDFSAALDKVMLDLAHQLVKDGEGATKFVRITVDGAASPASARKLAKSIADSPLVKTAIAGEDANWGRIVMAVGKTEEAVDRDRLAIHFGPHVAAVDGAPSPTYDEAKMSAYMKNAEIDITVHVGSGRASATVWTCDLTKRYIEINGDYRS
ncbi:MULTISPECIES: bifunctional glutamate N-acetyltransferase/amino-acid acetyltransferase ArgJ [unclassified Brevundimonas]|uniref:bifunctional glutamate N-acetyltransferase/amino-acid acetyltransferase ArgJ n=1 Tax=unclassified Brevundimonas TaxID=2622653 RepID=UPI000CFBF7DD|nr:MULTISPECIES: bifunctional glutamate N-acetyltransferase/amino-acid acetyltransferase ArgJ [unclassified Brevundimonas]PRA26813.1 bifunctional ornithine acetyltransferase/N-acetylglutamate synthase [Brevundimonas sp. MYb27]PQZ76421.1 bifunctional ornithine acetyltransferase/N-acetylglutamate synthase [Brevundimonas sp. MYb31]PRB14948.1 bifunctional ornithine acetyltransferase/N-acetylglutamate synthase [Brevundimonas sp. MYb52]PRB36950.1 bifunctional ornithine acetyltransferase/N-acetylgluta